jgi:RND superfamily putative drug exporter
MERLGGRAFAHRRLIMAATLWAIIGALLADSVFGVVKPFGFDDPASESARAHDALEEATGELAVPGVILLVEPPADTDGGEGKADVDRVAEQLGAIPGVARVTTPADDPSLMSRRDEAALVVGHLDASVDDISDVGESVAAHVDYPGVVAGGGAVTAFELNDVTEQDLRRIELIAAPLLFLLSLLVFRGLVAALLPMFVGGLSIISTLLLLRLLATVMEIDVFAINIVTGLGLGLAIDYSLFVVSQYREELDRYGATERALRATTGSVGRMILFSGLIVAAALASLVVFPQRFLYSIGVGGALVAFNSMLVSLVVLPALLAILGRRVNSLAPRRLQGRPDERRWSRLARFVLRRPLPIATVVIVAMVAAGLPFLRVELTRSDAATLPGDTSARQVNEAIHDRFDADPTSIITVAVESGAQAGQLETARRTLRSEPAVQRVTKPEEVNGLTRTDVSLRVPVFSDSALDVVETARSAEWGAPALVGGASAQLTDQRDSLADHLPLAIVIVVVSTAFALFVMTRSVALPLIALLMNALTLSVAFGVLVLVFQDGRFESLLDYTSPAALDVSVPILLFAVVFGLSTDYGVFLLHRIREEREAGATDSAAIARGLARSGRSITAAAVLFAVAMGAFVFSDLVSIKEVAVGTAVAVLVDATLVRGLLFPALIGMLGARAWWAPSRLAQDPRSVS